MLLDLDCPPPFHHLSGVVEFANTAFRPDFDWTIDPLGIPRVARMTPGVRVRPIFPGTTERTEATFEISTRTAECLQRDRVYQLPYFILGPNSNSAIRAVCQSCGVTLPDAVLTRGGPLGDFPGVEQTPGDEVHTERWPSLGHARAMP